MNFDKRIQLCNHHCNQGIAHFHPPTMFLHSLLQPTPPCTQQCLATIHLFPIPTVLSFPEWQDTFFPCLNKIAKGLTELCTDHRMFSCPRSPSCISGGENTGSDGCKGRQHSLQRGWLHKLYRAQEASSWAEKQLFYIQRQRPLILNCLSMEYPGSFFHDRMVQDTTRFPSGLVELLVLKENINYCSWNRI